MSTGDVFYKLTSVEGVHSIAVLLTLDTEELSVITETPLQDISRHMRVNKDFARMLVNTAENEMQRRESLLSGANLLNLYQRAKRGMEEFSDSTT